MNFPYFSYSFKYQYQTDAHRHVHEGRETETPGCTIVEFVYKKTRNGRISRYADIGGIFIVSLFQPAPNVVSPRLCDSSGDTPSLSWVFSGKGEITEVRKECEAERRTLNGIRIGRVPSISCRYYVIAPFSLVRRDARVRHCCRAHEVLVWTHLPCTRVASRFIVFFLLSSMVPRDDIMREEGNSRMIVDVDVDAMVGNSGDA